ncbi:hypothetical protein STENM36S_08954 [Streptomyces tendae]
MSNRELDAALATVPEIARTRQLHEDAKKRLRDHPAGDVPDVARNNVIDDAVRTFQADGSWPADLGKRTATHAEHIRHWSVSCPIPARTPAMRPREYTKRTHRRSFVECGGRSTSGPTAKRCRVTARCRASVHVGFRRGPV